MASQQAAVLTYQFKDCNAQYVHKGQVLIALGIIMPTSIPT